MSWFNMLRWFATHFIEKLSRLSRLLLPSPSGIGMCPPRGLCRGWADSAVMVTGIHRVMSLGNEADAAVRGPRDEEDVDCAGMSCHRHEAAAAGSQLKPP